MEVCRKCKEVINPEDKFIKPNFYGTYHLECWNKNNKIMAFIGIAIFSIIILIICIAVMF